jgi:hypothetical protein
MKSDEMNKIARNERNRKNAEIAKNERKKIAKRFSNLKLHRFGISGNVTFGQKSK